MCGFTSAAYPGTVRQAIDASEDVSAKHRARQVKRVRWAVGGLVAAALIGYGTWLVWTDAPAYQFLVRLYLDKNFLKHTLREWGILAPVIFIGLQALQVIIAPIPGELTGILGGFCLASGLASSNRRSGSRWGQWRHSLLVGGSALIMSSGW